MFQGNQCFNGNREMWDKKNTCNVMTNTHTHHAYVATQLVQNRF